MKKSKHSHPSSSHRSDRVGDLILRELSVLIQREIKDPRLTSMVTITAVEVTRDFAHAKVYVTIFDKDQDHQQAIDILNHAAGYLRSTLAKSLKLRTIPQLKFIYDSSLEYGNRMSDLIKQVTKDDE